MGKVSIDSGDFVPCPPLVSVFHAKLSFCCSSEMTHGYVSINGKRVSVSVEEGVSLVVRFTIPLVTSFCWCYLLSVQHRPVFSMKLVAVQ